MTQEALKLALEAFEQIFESTPPYRDDGTCVINDKSVELSNKAVAAIKQALAQPEQEPFGYFKAEPFGWTDCAESDVGAIALYQTPPQRTWVGLTDDEQQQAYEQWQNDGWGVFYNAIEAKLKDKNS